MIVSNRAVGQRYTVHLRGGGPGCALRNDANVRADAIADAEEKPARVDN